ncbi:D-glycero-beta-D-manno-heptose-1,7-bisphosphate 7-phosphatase, partial [bacterium]
GYSVLVLGKPIEYRNPGVVFAGDTTLRELIALIKLSRVFVGNDSGPLHISGAVGTPSVGIFGPTHPSLGYAPDSPNSRIIGAELPCRPCTLYGKGRCRLGSRLCMTLIEPDEVADAVEELAGFENTEPVEPNNASPRKPAVFLDRDGTIIADAHFLDDPAKIELLPGVAEAIKTLNDAKIPVVITTNQSGVARGYFDIETVETIHGRLREILAERGAKIDAIYFCPHHPEGEIAEYRRDCDCRKPKPGMAMKAASEFGLDLNSSFIVGDKKSDIEFARNIGARAILVRTGKGAQTERELRDIEPDAVFDSLPGAAKYIVEKWKKQ